MIIVISFIYNSNNIYISFIYMYIIIYIILYISHTDDISNILINQLNKK